MLSCIKHPVGLVSYQMWPMTWKFLAAGKEKNENKKEQDCVISEITKPRNSHGSKEKHACV